MPLTEEEPRFINLKFRREISLRLQPRAGEPEGIAIRMKDQ